MAAHNPVDLAPTMTGAMSRSSDRLVDGGDDGKGRRRVRWILGAFYMVSAVFVLVAIASSLDRAGDRVFPSWPTIAFALIALAAALRATASGWRALVDDKGTAVQLRRCVYASQFGKYVPGGVVQAVGQVAIAGSIGIPLRTAFPAYVVYAGHVAMGSLAVGTILATQASSVGARWAAVGGCGAIALLSASRPVLQAAVRVGQRFVPRLRRMGPVPSQPALIRCFGLQMVFALFQGFAFATLLRSLVPDLPVVAAVGAHTVAFGAGLLAVPVPSGLLVREGLLLAILHPVAGAAAIVTAAIVQRLAAIGAEVLMFLANSLVLYRAAGRRAVPQGET